jgi:hypothetical protein
MKILSFREKRHTFKFKITPDNAGQKLNYCLLPAPPHFSLRYHLPLRFVDPEIMHFCPNIKFCIVTPAPLKFLALVNRKKYRLSHSFVPCLFVDTVSLW